MNKIYKNWNISQGDYQKEIDNPLKYHESYKTKKKLSNLAKVVIALGVTLLVLGVVIAAVSH